MKTISKLILAFLLLSAYIHAQDSLYVVKSDSSFVKFGINEIKRITFIKPQAFGTTTDMEGHVYHWFTINNQTWMVENLRTSKYRNGESIKNITDNTEWGNLLYTTKTPGWCYYNNDSAKDSINGKLYNWFAVSDQRNIAPIGWHVASGSEWLQLIDYLKNNGYNYDGSAATIGNKLAKTIASSFGWTESTVEGAPGNNQSKNNITGFSAIPVGVRSSDGSFYGVGNTTAWWTSTDASNAVYQKYQACAYNEGLQYDNSYLQEGQRYGQWNTYDFGFSVRCIKNDYKTSAPALTTELYSLTDNVAKILSRITDYGNEPILRYNNTTSWQSGICWSDKPTPTLADNIVRATDPSNMLLNLVVEKGKKYYVRAFATNTIGTGYSNEIIVENNTVSVIIPTVKTDSINKLSTAGASVYGKIESNGGADITAKGFCWSTQASPTIDLTTKTVISGTTDIFSSLLTGLIPNTTYYVRAYATNSAGTGYGAEISFTTLARPVAVTDIDGNVYTSVTIGTQTWMVENLKTTHYRNGDVIANITDNTAWSALSTGAWCDYANTAANGTKYGHLYNWFAVADSRNIAPVGWHVATDVEWATLTTYLGGADVAGGKLKEIGTGNWLSPNTGATNESGFSALPGGYRFYYSGNFDQLGIDGSWWMASEYDTNYAWNIAVYNNYSNVYKSYGYKMFGFSVRCVRDDVSLPTLITSVISSVTSTTAIGGGNITSDGGASITARGVCWSTSANPTIANSKISQGTGTGTFTCSITGLTPATIYYYRAFATNSVGTSYGEIQICKPTFATNHLATGTITDIDGNTYNTITIGNQTWMMEDLRTTHYRNGEAIINVPDSLTWINATYGAYSNYGNSSKAGMFYNWFAASDSKNIAPVGWHVPTNSDVTTLLTYLGGAEVAGEKMKSETFLSNDCYSNNLSGFSGIMNGWRNDGKFEYAGTLSGWWTSTLSNPTDAYSLGLDNGVIYAMQILTVKKVGLNIRCIKD